MSEEQDAGTVAETESAEIQGNQGEEAEGTDTPSEEEESAAEQAEGEAEEENPEEKPEEATEEKTGKRQTTLEERAAEIAEKKVQQAIAAERERIERETAERQKEQEKPFVDLNQEQLDTLNRNYTDAISRKLELEENIRLGDISLVAELRKTERWIAETERWYADNEQKKSEWTRQQESKNAHAAEFKARLDNLTATADSYQKVNQIPDDVWAAGQEWFVEQLKADPELNLKFRAMVENKATTSYDIVKFADKYVADNMGKKAEDALAQKEKAKEQLAPAVSGKVKVSIDAEYKKALEHARANPDDDEAWVRFSELKRQRVAKGA